MYVGATKDNNAIKRHTRTATAVGMLSGAIGGTIGAPVIGTVVGGVGGGLLSYAGAKLGQHAGKNMRSAKK